MKNNCVLCGILLKDSHDRYIQYGNFCNTCTQMCSSLSIIYPGDKPYISGENLKLLEDSSNVKDIDKLQKYKRKLENWYEKKESYERQSNKFQTSLKK